MPLTSGKALGEQLQQSHFRTAEIKSMRSSKLMQYRSSDREVSGLGTPNGHHNNDTQQQLSPRQISTTVRQQLKARLDVAQQATQQGFNEHVPLITAEQAKVMGGMGQASQYLGQGRQSGMLTGVFGEQMTYPRSQTLFQHEHEHGIRM
jgi:hypothetical protein